MQKIGNLTMYHYLAAVANVKVSSDEVARYMALFLNEDEKMKSVYLWMHRFLLILLMQIPHHVSFD